MIFRTIAVISVSIGLCLTVLFLPSKAEAHTITKQHCKMYGLIHQFTMQASGKRVTRLCMDKVYRHNLHHKCMAASKGIVNSSGVCHDLVSSVVSMRSIPDSWAYNRNLFDLVDRESSWNKNAINSSSGACGLFQRLPCPWSVSSSTVHASRIQQMKNGLHYINGRYGSPDRAIQHHNEFGWY
jgi:hypothetical protein